MESFKERAGIMVERGGCSFVKKTLNIQKIGAKLAVIADNIDEDEGSVIMVDYKNDGDLVHIPTYLIGHQVGLDFTGFTFP